MSRILWSAVEAIVGGCLAAVVALWVFVAPFFVFIILFEYDRPPHPYKATCGMLEAARCGPNDLVYGLWELLIVVSPALIMIAAWLLFRQIARLKW